MRYVSILFTAIVASIASIFWGIHHSVGDLSISLEGAAATVFIGGHWVDLANPPRNLWVRGQRSIAIFPAVHWRPRPQRVCQVSPDGFRPDVFAVAEVPVPAIPGMSDPAVTATVPLLWVCILMGGWWAIRWRI